MRILLTFYRNCQCIIAYPPAHFSMIIPTSTRSIVYRRGSFKPIRKMVGKWRRDARSAVTSPDRCRGVTVCNAKKRGKRRGRVNAVK